jgi:hypothetical protein
MQSYQRKAEVFFDVNNEEHRMAYYHYHKSNGWSYPWIFVLEKNYLNIPNMIKDKLLQHYMDLEFIDTK